MIQEKQLEFDLGVTYWESLKGLAISRAPWREGGRI